MAASLRCNSGTGVSAALSTNTNSPASPSETGGSPLLLGPPLSQPPLTPHSLTTNGSGSSSVGAAGGGGGTTTTTILCDGGRPSDAMSEISDAGTTTSGFASNWSSREELRDIMTKHGFKDIADLYQERFRVDRKKLEQMLSGDNDALIPADVFFANIMEDTGTYITWPNRLKLGVKSKKDPHVRIAGRQQDVEIAKQRIMAILYTRCNRVTMKMDISYTDHSHIIGKGGLSIKRVMEETQCHVHFPDSNRSNPTEKSNQVSISGDLEGVEMARGRVRELIPLIFGFEPPIMAQNVDINCAFVQKIQEQYKVQVMFKTRSKLHATIVLVKGVEWEVDQVKQATMLLMEYMCENLTSQIPVQMSIQISPQHHHIVLGKNHSNLKAIMQYTNCQIMFPDAHDQNIPSLKKSNVNIAGNIHNVYMARQLLIGSLPLLIIFDLPEADDVQPFSLKPEQIADIQTSCDVSISIRQKTKQAIKACIIKGVEKHAGNMYRARNMILGIDEPTVNADIPRSYFIQQPCAPIVSSQTNGVHMQPETTLDVSNNNNAVNGNGSSMVVTSTPFLDALASSTVVPTPPLFAHSPVFTNVTNGVANATVPPTSTVWPSYYATSLSSAYHHHQQQQQQQPLPPPHTLRHPNPFAAQYLKPTPQFLYSNGGATLENGQAASPAVHVNGTMANNGNSNGYHQHQLNTSTGTDSSGNSSGSGGSHGSPNQPPHDHQQTLPTYKHFEDSKLDASSARFTYEHDLNSKRSLGQRAMQQLQQQQQQRSSPAQYRHPSGTSWSGYGINRNNTASMLFGMIGGGGGVDGGGSGTSSTNGANYSTNDAVNLNIWGHHQQSNGSGRSGGILSYRSPIRATPPPNLNTSNILDHTPSHIVQRLTSATTWSDLPSLLSSIGLEQYVSLFVKHEIDLSTFATLNENDLCVIGIHAFGSRRKLLLAISELNKRSSPFSMAPGAERKSSSSSSSASSRNSPKSW